MSRSDPIDHRDSRDCRCDQKPNPSEFLNPMYAPAADAVSMEMKNTFPANSVRAGALAERQGNGTGYQPYTASANMKKQDGGR